MIETYISDGLKGFYQLECVHGKAEIRKLDFLAADTVCGAIF